MGATREAVDRPIRDKSTAILDAALEVFAERGVNGVAVPEIASRAQVGTGTIYRYFPGKEALVNELFRREKRALGRRLNEGFGEISEPKALFDEFWRRAIAFAREQPHAYRFLELQDHRPYLDEESRRLERKVISPMQRSVRDWQAQEVFRADMRDEVIMTMVWGAFVNLFKAERDGHIKLTVHDLEKARDACWRMFVPASAPPAQ